MNYDEESTKLLYLSELDIIKVANIKVYNQVTNAKFPKGFIPYSFTVDEDDKVLYYMDNNWALFNPSLHPSKQLTVELPDSSSLAEHVIDYLPKACYRFLNNKQLHTVDNVNQLLKYVEDEYTVEQLKLIRLDLML